MGTQPEGVAHGVVVHPSREHEQLLGVDERGADVGREGGPVEAGEGTAERVGRGLGIDRDPLPERRSVRWLLRTRWAGLRCPRWPGAR